MFPLGSEPRLEHHWDCPVTVGSPGARQVQAGLVISTPITCVSGQGQHELFQVVTCVTTTANLSIHDSLGHSSESRDFSRLISPGNSEPLGWEYYLLTCLPLG